MLFRFIRRLKNRAVKQKRQPQEVIETDLNWIWQPFENSSTLQFSATVKKVAAAIIESSADDIGYVNVTLTQSNKVIAIPKGQSILVSLEHEGLKPTHGCRMGICNKCVCNKSQGSTRNLLNGSENTEPSQLLKICVNSAQSDLVIDL